MGHRSETYDGAGNLISVTDTRTVPESAAERIAAIKAQAAERINAIAPDYKQRNLTARAAELALLFPGTKGEELPEPYRSEYITGQAVWDAIKAIRAASNAAEAQVQAIAAAASGNDDLAACDAIEACGW